MAEPLQLSLPESFWAVEGRRLAVLIVPRLTALALEGARRGSEKIGIGFNYGIYNLLAEQWAREYTDALLKQVRTTNEAVVGDILARWISTLGSTFGDLHAALQPYFGVKRASVIAVTEATRAMASGELLAYQRAGIEKIQWGTNKDELVCPYCGGVNREVRTIGEPFGYFKWRKGQQPEPVYAPPYHPNCRCGISPVLASVSVRKTVLILTDAAIVARTLRTLPPILAKGDFDGHPFRGNQWTETEKGIDSRGALWRRYPVRDAKGNATKNYAYTVDGGEDIPEPLAEAINKNTSEGWRLVRFNYNAKSKTWHIADAGEDDVPTHAMFANESMEANGTEADDLVRGFYDIEQNAISIYDFTGFDNDNLVRTKTTEKYLRSAERNLFTYNGERPKLLYLTLDDMQMAAGPGDLAKHDGPGPHDNGSPQSVHGSGTEGQGEGTRAFIEKYPYLYHISERKNTASIANEGIRRSKKGYSGPGAYLATSPEATQYHISLKEDYRMFRIPTAEAIGMFPAYMDGGTTEWDEESGEVLFQQAIPASLVEWQDSSGNWRRGVRTSKYKKDAGPADLAKGDFDGHPFRGNQWTEDGAGPDWRSVDFRAPSEELGPEARTAIDEYGRGIIPANEMIRILKRDEEYDAFQEVLQDQLGQIAVKGMVTVYRGGEAGAGKISNGTLDINKARQYASGFTGLPTGQIQKYKVPVSNFVAIGSTGEQEVFFSITKTVTKETLQNDNVTKLAKHDGPGPHDNGSPQEVHGGDEGAGPAEKTGVAAIDNPYDFVRDRRNTELPMAIENGIDGGPAQSILYHGTTTKGLESLTSEHGDVYITPQPEEAAGYAMDMHRFGSNAKPGEVLMVRRRAGKTLNLTDAIDQGFENGYEPDEVIAGVRQAAKDRGFRYLYFSHPSFADNEEQHAIISLFPEEDLRVLKRQRVKKLAKHDGMGPHDNGSPQSVHGGKGKGANPAQPGAKAKRPREKQKAAEVKVTSVAAQAPAPAAETQAPTTFEDWREAQAWAADQKSMFPDMNPEEQNAMNKYKRSSKYYAQVNSYLRTGKFKEGEFIENAFSDGGQAESYAQIVDGVMAKTSLENELVVYRALSSKAIPVGTKEFTDKGFGSTSLAKSQGKRFVGFVKDDGQTPAIMNIKVPKGAKAVYMETLWDNGEAEVLLPRNTRYRIISEGRNEDGVRIINAEVIND